MTDKTAHEAEDKVWSMMKSIGICMLATKTGEGIRSRPVAAYARPDEHAVYIMTDVSGDKDNEIEADPHVNLAFAAPGKNSYVSLTGTAAVTNDRAKIKELWNTAAKAWWDGPEDPAIRLLKIAPEKAEYWDGPNMLVAGAIMAFRAATGQKGDLGENKKVAL